MVQRTRVNQLNCAVQWCNYSSREDAIVLRSVPIVSGLVRLELHLRHRHCACE